MAADELAAAREENEKLVTEGYRLLNEGRQDEAELIATSAIANDPSSPTSLALLGDCHERARRYDEALSCYERVVELQPDSALDRVRVAHLRKLLTDGAGRPVHRSPKPAVFAAVAAIALVGSIGAIIAIMVAPGNSTPAYAAKGPEISQLQAFDPAALDDPQHNASQPPKVQPEAPKPQPAPAAGAAATGGRPVPNLNFSGLPNPVPNGSTVNPNNGNLPLNPLQGIRVVPDGAGTAGQAPANTENPDPLPENGGTEASPPKPAPPEPVIEIRASGGSQPKVTQGGGETASAGSDVKAETLIRVARNQFMTGNYAAASDAYERALRAGAPLGSTNQRLAQCYEKLGRSGDAIAAYGRAGRAFDNAGNSSAAAACRAAIKVLQGG